MLIATQYQMEDPHIGFVVRAAGSQGERGRGGEWRKVRSGDKSFGDKEKVA